MTRLGGHAFLPAAMLVMLAGLAVPAPTASAAPALVGHAPISIIGDADFCDDEDGDGSVGQDDGIVNCQEADGSPARPYRVAGWSIRVESLNACVDAAVPPGCDLPSLCPGTLQPGCPLPEAPPECTLGDFLGAAVTICQTSKHVVFEDLDVLVAATQASIAGVSVLGSSHVVLDGVQLTTSKGALHVGRVVASDGRGSPATDIHLVRSGLTALVLGEDNTIGGVPARALVDVVDGDLEIDATRIDATKHQDGIVVDNRLDAQDGRRHVFSLTNSVLANATTRGVFVWSDTEVEIRGNRFLDNGLGEPSAFVFPGVEASLQDPFVIDLAGGEYQVWDNEFELRSGGVTIQTNASGWVGLNRFTGSAQGFDALTVQVGAGFGCGAHFSYNDLATMGIRNGNALCALDARWNWWGQPEGPSGQGSGQFLVGQVKGTAGFQPWLRLPLDKLPQVRILEPEAQASVAGRVWLRGEATSPSMNRLVRVEATETYGDWSEAAAASGLETWSVELDLSGAAAGLHSVWVRGCAETDCGPPARLDLSNLGAPRPPVALLTAARRFVAVDEPVVLAAGGSYARDGLAVEAYRFLPGDGRAGEWTPNATTEIRYTTSGQYRTSLDVRDTLGAVSPNLAILFVYVEGGEATAKSVSDGASWLPGPSLLVLTAAVGAVVWPLRRRAG